MPAAIPIAIAVMAASSVYAGVEGNQERQHAKGAAEAQQTAMDAQTAEAKKAAEDMQKKQSDLASANALKETHTNMLQDFSMARMRAMVSGSNTNQGSLLTSPLGAAPAPVATKSLLGA